MRDLSLVKNETNSTVKCTKSEGVWKVSEANVATKMMQGVILYGYLDMYVLSKCLVPADFWLEMLQSVCTVLWYDRVPTQSIHRSNIQNK